jgi:cytochrome c556
MKTIHWLFVVSVLLFVFGIGFIIAGAREIRRAPAAQASAPAAAPPVASIKQIMRGITGPAANVVFEAVSTTVSAAGIEEHAPKTDAEWDAVGSSAAALVESANMLIAEGRSIDRDEWVKMSRAMADAGMTALKATQAKDAAGVLAAGEAINTSCDNCHRKYQRNEG